MKTSVVGLVAAAFASLNSPEGVSSSMTPSPKSVKQSRLQQVESQIARAGDVNSLLAVAEMPVLSRKHALKVSTCMQSIIYCSCGNKVIRWWILCIDVGHFCD